MHKDNCEFLLFAMLHIYILSILPGNIKENPIDVDLPVAIRFGYN
jgi:hypothetical protein